MKKKHQRLLILLLGLIAAMASSWAVYVVVSYEDHATTATNGGQVIQNTRKSSISHTGFGDIVTGIQHKGKGDINLGTRIQPESAPSSEPRPEPGSEPRPEPAQ